MKSKVRESMGDRLLMLVIYICLTVFLLIVLYPLLWVVSAAGRVMAGADWYGCGAAAGAAV